MKMIDMRMSLDAKNIFLLSIGLLISADLAILLNIPFLRQILGFLFLTILPGLLILQILKLNKIGFTEKFVLSVGLSVSFLMFFGLVVNNLSLSLGYLTPLSTISLLISFNIAFIILAIIGYKTKTFEKSFTKTNFLGENRVPKFNLTTSEKVFLIVPILFPALSIFGMHVMNTTDNNLILMLLLFLIPIYVVFVCIFNQKIPKRLYPVVIFLISISLLLMFSLRSNHLLGSDTHQEYYFFQITLNSLHWSIFEHSTLDACLSISLLPATYQSLLNTSPEFLFKILYSLIYSVSPLAIYVISKRYIEEHYAFLASFFFMSQGLFLTTPANSRTSIAILFFALAMMTLFSDKIDPLKKRILFIVFMASCMVSHYSTTYVFFFILLGMFIGVEILSKKYTFKKDISLTLVMIFFSIIFFWYSQVTETAFNAGVSFIGKTLTNLNDMFIGEMRSESTQMMFGGKLVEEEIAYSINFFFNWAIIAFIGIGIITCIIRYKEMSFPELNFKKVDFLNEKFGIEFFIVALTCIGVLVAVVTLPYLTKGYDLSRPHAVTIVILSIFFVIGGITLSKITSLNLLRKVLSKTLRGKKRLLKKQKQEKNQSEVRAYLVILLVLIPYFFCVTGVTYAMFGEPRSIILTSEGMLHDRLYVHDQESYGAKWLKEYSESKSREICTDRKGRYMLTSQGKINIGSTNEQLLFRNEELTGNFIYYIYLGYTTSIQGKLFHGRIYNLEDISNALYKTDKIYDSDVVIYKKEK